MSTESPGRTTDGLSRFVDVEFAPDVVTEEDVGIKVGEFGEEVPRRGAELDSRSVLAIVVDRVVMATDAIFEDGGGIELVRVGEAIDRVIRV